MAFKATLAVACRRLGKASSVLAVTWTQQRCSLVAGNTSLSAPQNPECSVTDRERRVREPPAPQPPQHLPRLGGLSVAVGQRDQLFRAVEADAHDHEAAQPVLFQSDVEVHPVCPHVHVVDARQVALGPLCVLGLPRLGEPVDRVADSPASVPKNSPSAGAKSPVDSPRR